MKSIEIELHGRAGTGSGFNRPLDLVRDGLVRLQTSQVPMYCATSFCIRDQ